MHFAPSHFAHRPSHSVAHYSTARCFFADDCRCACDLIGAGNPVKTKTGRLKTASGTIKKPKIFTSGNAHFPKGKSGSGRTSLARRHASRPEGLLPRHGIADGQAATPLVASARKDGASVFGRHTGTISVLIDTFAIMRLECALHLGRPLSVRSANLIKEFSSFKCDEGDLHLLVRPVSLIVLYRRALLCFYRANRRPPL